MKFTKPTHWSNEEWAAFSAKLTEVTKGQTEKRNSLRSALTFIKKAMPEGEDKTLNYIAGLIENEMNKLGGKKVKPKPAPETAKK